MPKKHRLMIPSWNAAVLECLTSKRRDAHGSCWYESGTRVVRQWYESGAKVVRTRVLLSSGEEQPFCHLLSFSLYALFPFGLHVSIFLCFCFFSSPSSPPSSSSFHVICLLFFFFGFFFFSSSSYSYSGAAVA